MTTTIEKGSVDVLVIEAERLDPITVFLQDFGPGQGRVTIVCYGRAWSSYWGAMGNDRSIRAFMLSCDDGYLVTKLTDFSMPADKRTRKNADEYLLRIVKSMREGLLIEMGVTKP